MAQIGVQDNSQRTADFALTRNELIELAYGDLCVLAEGESLSEELLTTGIKKLNLIMREEDVTGKHLWALSFDTIPLVANTFAYTVDNGLPNAVLSIVKASFRDGSQQDTPLEVLTTEQYECQSNKLETGDPRWLFLPEHNDVSLKTLYVGPMLSEVDDQSEVTGYQCIRSHTADSTNEPGSGANALLYWEAGGTGSDAWASGTSYTAPQHLRLWFRRPLYDFDAADDNPDIPPAWSLWLQKQLAIELAPGHNVSIDKINILRSLRNESNERVFRSKQPQTTKTHNFAEYM